MDYPAAKLLLKNPAQELGLEQLQAIQQELLTFKLLNATDQETIIQSEARKLHENSLLAYFPAFFQANMTKLYAHLDKLEQVENKKRVALLKLWWGTEKPSNKKVKALKQAFHTCLIQQVSLKKGEELQSVLSLILSEFSNKDLAEHEELWLDLYAQSDKSGDLRNSSPVFQFLIAIASERALKPVFEHYFEHPDPQCRQMFFYRYNYLDPIATFFLDKIKLQPKLSLIQEYAQFFAYSELCYPLYDFLVKWAQALPESDLEPEPIQILAFFVKKAPDSHLLKLEPLWQRWCKSQLFELFSLASKALLRFKSPENVAVLTERLFHPAISKRKLRFLLNALAQQDPFQDRQIWLESYLSVQPLLKDSAYLQLLTMTYPGDTWDYRSGKKRRTNDPAFWRQLWLEGDTRALRLNGACQLLLAEPDNAEVQTWMLQQMETLPLKSLYKVWACFQSGCAEDFQRDLALKHINSSRQVLRELALKQFKRLKWGESELAVIQAALADQALPVQISAAKVLAQKAREQKDPAQAGPLLTEWLRQTLNGNHDYAKEESLKIVGHLNLSYLWPEIQTLDGKVSPRLQRAIEKAKAKLLAAQ
ncbi:MAG: hypothetical protein IV090_03050 [Candidatus Sericytochromatia bacterium]|nr:hypothetical protein [Candidatus Sericytochromatia bacterium]